MNTLLAFFSETAIPNQSKIKLLEGSIQDVWNVYFQTEQLSRERFHFFLLPRTNYYRI